MHYKKGKERDQMFFASLEEMVPSESFARVIDLMVDSLPLEDLGFKNSRLQREGNIPYHPGDILKLLIYGQRHGIRSANKLSRACIINTEIMWLLKGLRPSSRTICYFRTNNIEAIKSAHKNFVKSLQSWKLITGEVLALDSTKVRGQNSLKNNFNQKKIDRHLSYLNERIEDYLSQLENIEEEGKEGLHSKEIKEKIENAEKRKTFYTGMEEQIRESKDGQISTTDPDSRAVIKHRNIVEVGYNIQATVDSKHNIIVDVFAGGVTDRGDLGLAAKRSQKILGLEKIDLLADKGYHNGADIAYCERRGVRTFIPPSKQHHQKEKGFRKKDFEYDAETDTYTCPSGEKLNYELTFKKKNNRRSYRVKRYGTRSCENCPLKLKCTTSNRGRKIERPNHQLHRERNDARVKRYQDFYRLRQQIVEPIFGIWKRQWHFDHLMMRTKPKVEMEVSLAALTYNLMRLLSVKGLKWIEKKMRSRLNSLISEIRQRMDSLFMKRGMFY